MTGEPTPYTLHDEGTIETALDTAFRRWDSGNGGGAPQNMTVHAKIEWAGEFDRGRGGYRTTRLDSLRMGPVREALEKAREATRRAGETQPLKSMTAKGWHAQLNALTRSSRGSAATDKVGFSPSERAVKEWLSESRAPSRANQEKISQAYNALRSWNVDSARSEADKARHKLAQALSDTVGTRYGSEVRFFDIKRLDLN